MRSSVLLIVALAACLAVAGVSAYPRFAQLADSQTAPGASAAPVFPVVAGAAPISTLAGPLRPGVVAVKPVAQLNPTQVELRQLVDKKTVCPFIGAATNSKLLPVFGTLESPYTLASSVRDLCNTGGGDFGDMLYTIALVNLPGPKVTGGANPGLGYSTLSLAGSIAAHAGHSGILSGPSSVPNAGRFDPSQWSRLLLRQQGGFLTTDALAHWVAENMLLDPLATPWNIMGILSHIKQAVGAGVPLLMESIADKLKKRSAGAALQPAATKLQTEKDLKPVRQAVMAGLASNLFNAAAEMAFIVTVFKNSPRSRQATPTVPFGLAVKDIEEMFVQRVIPEGFLSWPKRKADFGAVVGSISTTAAGALLKARTIDNIHSVEKALTKVGKI